MAIMKTLLGLAVIAIVVTGCRKDADAPEPVPTTPPTPSHVLRVIHHVDDLPLEFDTLLYTNEAGHLFSITRLEYYISDLQLQREGEDHLIPGPYYINARNNVNIDLGTVPEAAFSNASMLLGLPPQLNTTGALPVTMENNAMAWPDPMGGGYHFIKLEGHFINGNSSSGYAMHIGMDEFLAHCIIPDPIDIGAPPGELVLRFNINEIFRSPHVYDLASGNYSMGNMMLMGQLRDNLTDAFTLTYEP